MSKLPSLEEQKTKKFERLIFETCLKPKQRLFTMIRNTGEKKFVFAPEVPQRVDNAFFMAWCDIFWGSKRQSRPWKTHRSTVPGTASAKTKIFPLFLIIVSNRGFGFQHISKISRWNFFVFCSSSERSFDIWNDVLVLHGRAYFHVLWCRVKPYDACNVLFTRFERSYGFAVQVWLCYWV